MSKPQTPATPDLVGAAQQSGQSNIQAAIAQALLGHVNQVTPFGSQTWSQSSPTGGTPSSGMPNYTTGGTGPGGTVALPMSGTGVWGGSLAPPQYSAMGLGSDLRGTFAPGGTTPGVLGGPIGSLLKPGGPLGGGQAPASGAPVSSTPFDPSSIPQFTETTTLSPQQQAIFDAQQGTQATTAGKAGQLASGIDTSPLDFSGAPPMPSGADQNAQLQNVQNALYGRQAQYLDPQFATGQRQLDNKLAQQGFQVGDEGVSNSAGTGAQDSFDMAKQKAYSDARDSAIANSSSQLAQNSQTAIQQRQQAISEALAQRNQPINELAALGGGGSIGMPTFPSTGGTQGIPGTDFLGAASGQNAANLQNFGIQSGQYNSQVGGLAGLGGILAMLMA